ncbi:MAG: hypothetical protein QG670_2365 [Thermoproteota archaeon]|nr:hypothetical protein [Thermoproteota archaeon]
MALFEDTGIILSSEEKNAERSLHCIFFINVVKKKK